MTRRETVTFGLVIAAVIIVPGVANAVLGDIGYPALGSTVWAVGYGGGAVLIWYYWIRPLGITAPDGAAVDPDDRRQE
jgi:hypothetical protein